MQNNSQFFANTACQHFPCHSGIDPEDFNCLYCYCPLYMLGPACGGNFSYTEKGRKSCKDCNLPHCGVQGAQMVAEHFEEIARRAEL